MCVRRVHIAQRIAAANLVEDSLFALAAAATCAVAGLACWLLVWLELWVAVVIALRCVSPYAQIA